MLPAFSHCLLAVLEGPSQVPRGQGFLGLGFPRLSLPLPLVVPSLLAVLVPCLPPAPSPDAWGVGGWGGLAPAKYTGGHTRERPHSLELKYLTRVAPCRTGCMYTCGLLCPNHVSSSLLPPFLGCARIVGRPGSLLPFAAEMALVPRDLVGLGLQRALSPS